LRQNPKNSISDSKPFVVLVNPPYLEGFSRGQRSPAVIKSGTMYYPYWLASATGVLEKNGFDVKLIDAPAENLTLRTVLSQIKALNPGLIVIETSTPSIENDINFAKVVKQQNERGVVCLVGTHPTVNAEFILKENPEIDFIARGEYDFTLVELGNSIRNGEEYQKINGISFNDSGKVIHNDNREYIKNLDEIPFLSKVYKKHLCIDNYYFSIVKNPMVMLITGRGCPNKCFFCVYPQIMHGRKYRFRSAQNVVEELIFIKKELPQVREVAIEDDTFTANKKRARQIAELILKHNLKIDWFANIRVDVDYETLRLMKKAGLNSCAVGFESGSQELLNSMKKGMTLEQSIKFMENCKKLGIIVHGCFMVGFPGETKNTMEQTFQFAQKLGCDSAQFYPIFLYPGTEAFRWAKKHNYLRNLTFSQWLDSTGSHQCVYDIPGLSAEEMMKFCENAYKRFHLNPRYISRKIWQGLKNPDEGLKTIRSGYNYLSYLITK
jgi:radical SAM superfamily enzyme YgiQ (UPF0313 family)